MTTPSIHYKIRFKGSQLKVHIFNQILSFRDRDYPGTKLAPQICAHCKGLVWDRPLFAIDELKRLGAQLNQDQTMTGSFKVKIDQWITDECCDRNQPQC